MSIRDLLSDPPWLRKRTLPETFPGADAIEIDLAKLPVPMVWRPHERERMLGRAREIPALGRSQIGMNARQIEERAVAIQDETPPSDRLSLHTLLQLELEDTARLFNLLPLRAFVSEAASLQAIVARLEARGALGLVRRAQDMALRPTVFRLFPAVGTPLAVPALLDAFLRLQSLRGISKRAFVRFADPMLEAIVPLAAGTPAKLLGLVPIQKPAELVRSARLALHWLAGMGERERSERVAKKYGLAEALEAILGEDPLTGLPFIAPESILEAARPRWKNGEPLSDQEWSCLLVWLSLQDWDTPRLGTIQKELEHLEPSMRSLFEAFVEARAPKRLAWIPFAAFELGGRDTAHHIQTTLRSWKSVYEVPSAEVIRSAGVVAARHFGDPVGDATLEVLGEIAVKGSSKSQEERAQEAIQFVDDELEDVDDLAERLVPSLGLDERGRVRLDYGGRAFFARLGTALELQVLDDENNRLAKLPGVKKSDDEAKAKEAKAVMKALGRDARRLVSRVTARMQTALRTQKRWPAPVFELLVVRHPVVGSVARGLVWMAFDGDRAVTTFHVVEDRTFADVHGKRFELAIGHEVAVAHPALVDVETWSSWARVIGEYEIIQPIPQLAWPVVRLSPAELASTELRRFFGVELSSDRLASIGWHHGPVRVDLDATCTYEAIFEGIRAMLFHDPNPKDPWARRIVAGSLRLQRLEETSWERFLPLSTLGPVTTSEMVRELSG
jgi:hypothetical protein